MEYAREGLGEWAGFTIGWLYWYFWVGVVAFEAVIVGRILHEWIPAVPDWTFALAGLLLLTISNLCPCARSARLEFRLASIKVSAIVVFLIFGTLYVLGLLPNSTGSVGIDVARFHALRLDGRPERCRRRGLQLLRHRDRHDGRGGI